MPSKLIGQWIMTAGAMACATWALNSGSVDAETWRMIMLASIGQGLVGGSVMPAVADRAKK